jgi:hypothetical protein
MVTYPVRNTHRGNLQLDRLREIAQEYLQEVQVDGDSVRAQFGAIESLRVRGSGRDLDVEVRMNPQVPEEVQRDTIGRYNRFLEAATGYTAKERAKRLQKAAKAARE